VADQIVKVPGDPHPLGDDPMLSRTLLLGDGEHAQPGLVLPRLASGPHADAQRDGGGDQRHVGEELVAHDVRRR